MLATRLKSTSAPRTRAWCPSACRAWACHARACRGALGAVCNAARISLAGHCNTQRVTSARQVWTHPDHACGSRCVAADEAPRALHVTTGQGGARRMTRIQVTHQAHGRRGTSSDALGNHLVRRLWTRKSSSHSQWPSSIDTSVPLPVPRAPAPSPALRSRRRRTGWAPGKAPPASRCLRHGVPGSPVAVIRQRGTRHRGQADMRGRACQNRASVACDAARVEPHVRRGQNLRLRHSWAIINCQPSTSGARPSGAPPSVSASMRRRAQLSMGAAGRHAPGRGRCRGAWPARAGTG